MSFFKRNPVEQDEPSASEQFRADTLATIEEMKLSVSFHAGLVHFHTKKMLDAERTLAAANAALTALDSSPVTDEDIRLSADASVNFHAALADDEAAENGVVVR